MTDLHIVGPEIFRGDSWQLLLSPSNYALHAAFYIRAALKSGGRADTRIGVGIGDVQTLGSVLGQSDGPAFRLSGKALDGLKKSETLACLLAPAHFTNAQTESLLNASLKFAARFTDEWSMREAWAVLKVLEGKTQQSIAREWPGGETSQQNVAAALRRAGWPQLNYLLAVFSKLMNTIK